VRKAVKWTRKRARAAVKFLRRRRLLKPLVWTTVAFALLGSAVFGYYYVQFSRLIEARLHGERDRVIPRVFARPLTFNTGQVISPGEVEGDLLPPASWTAPPHVKLRASTTAGRT
jgi:hypothetical protein